ASPLVPETHAVTPHAGTQPIPGYRLTQPLGKGGFAEVWEARRDDGEGTAALKFLDCRQRSASMVSGEIRTLRGLSGLKHPHIIGLQAVQAWGQYIVLVMERADGNLDDLRHAYKARTGGDIPPAHALDLLDQAASALDFLAAAKPVGLPSSRGLQHCDIKPSNLLLIGDTLKVADFGLCAGTGWTTHLAGCRGTPPYAAPETYRGQAAPGTDQYALAVTYCSMVMGERPFWQADLCTTPPMGMPIDLTKLREHEFPVIARALHPYPSSRWPSCREFVAQLRKVGDKGRPSAKIYPRGKAGSLRHAGMLLQASATSTT
ncbi:MAG: serine/threonine protein kinase, partial [Thermoleophilia bacterium]|nr:serine/threonine protein kinase [Thermoleophilia bacterium]